jgi:5-methylcytosine-specific restriction enzyme subunit McrC
MTRCIDFMSSVDIRITTSPGEVRSGQEFFDSLAGILARRIVDRVRKGLYREYVAIDEDLSTLRGRLDACHTALNVASGRPHLRCAYEDNSADVIHNQILKTTLNLIAQQGVSRVDVRQTVRKAWRALSGEISLTQLSSSDCVNRTYNRLNHDYCTLHLLCRFFVDHTGPNLKSGDRGIMPFAIDMPKLFERCVARWLALHLPAQVVVSEQFRAVLSGGSGIVFKVDLVLKSRSDGRVLAVIDTKYKTDSTPSAADVAQVVAYATELGCGAAILAYPMNLAESFVATVGPIRVTRAAFDTQLPPEQAGSELLRQLKTQIIEL